MLIIMKGLILDRGISPNQKEILESDANDQRLCNLLPGRGHKFEQHFHREFSFPGRPSAHYKPTLLSASQPCVCHFASQTV